MNSKKYGCYGAHFLAYVNYIEGKECKLVGKDKAEASRDADKSKKNNYTVYKCL